MKDFILGMIVGLALGLGCAGFYIRHQMNELSKEVTNLENVIDGVIKR